MKINAPQAIMESIEEQLDSIKAVKGEAFAQLVTMGISGISLMKIVSTVEDLVQGAANGNPPPRIVLDGYRNAVSHVLAMITANAADALKLTAEQGGEAMEWASKISDGAQQRMDAMLEAASKDKGEGKE